MYFLKREGKCVVFENVLRVRGIKILKLVCRGLNHVFVSNAFLRESRGKTFRENRFRLQTFYVLQNFARRCTNVKLVLLRVPRLFFKGLRSSMQLFT